MISTYTSEYSDIKIEVSHPEGFEEKESKNLCILFADPQDQGRQLGMEIEVDEDFSINSTSDVLPYANYLIEELALSKIHKTKMNFIEEGLVYSFSASTEDNHDISCIIYIKKIDKNLVIGTLATSPKSLDAAVEDLSNFLENIYWGKDSNK